MQRYRTVRSPSDSLPLDVLEITPEGKPEGIVLIVHGMQEHKERYLGFMGFLAQKGYACVAHDHRGHGKSILSSDDLGYFYEENAQAIVEDLDAASASLRLRWPHLPFFIIAHSMGTLIARKYLKTHDEGLAGMILSGPVYENPRAKAGEMLVDIISKYKGDHHISHQISRLVEGAFDQKIEGTHRNRWLNSDPDEVDAFNADPLCGKPFTLNGYKNLLRLVQDAYSETGWKVRSPHLPILFAAGEDDPVIGSEHEFEKMQKFMKKRGYDHVHGKLYPHMRHEILNEADRTKVYEDFYNFLKEHTYHDHRQ